MITYSHLYIFHIILNYSNLILCVLMFFFKLFISPQVCFVFIFVITTTSSIGLFICLPVTYRNFTQNLPPKLTNLLSPKLLSQKNVLLCTHTQTKIYTIIFLTYTQFYGQFVNGYFRHKLAMDPQNNLNNIK